MNWDAIGTISEGLGALGVIITLVVLVVQLKIGRISVDANTRAIEASRMLAIAQSHQSRVDYIAANMAALRESKHLALFAGLTEPESDEDRNRLRYHLTTLASYADNLHFQYSLGYVDEETYQSQMLFTIRLYAPRWRAAGIVEARTAFKTEVDRYLEAAHSA